MAEDLMKTFSEALTQNVKEVDELLIPLLREYLNNVRSIRMAMANEVQLIIQSSRQLNEITRGNDKIMELAETLQTLRDVLTPEMLERLRKLSSE